MNDRQQTRLSMFSAVGYFIKYNEAKLNALPGFSIAREELESIIDQLRNLMSKQVLNRTGYTEGKAEIKSKLIFQAADISRKIVAFATLSGNSILKAEVKYTQNILRKTPDLQLEDRCKIIYQRAKSNLENLAPFNVTETSLATLETQIKAFSIAIPQTKTYRNNRKLITENVETLFEKGNDILRNRIDVLIEIIREADKNLYNAYRNSRRLISKFGTHKLAVKVNVSDITGMPLGEVEATIAGFPKTKKTSDKGSFKIPKMPTGTYIFKFSKNGYKPVSTTVFVTKGIMTKVDVVMEGVLEDVSVLV